MKVIIIRPQSGADATASRAKALGLETLGLEPVTMPLFAVTAVDWQAPDPNLYDALLITSANAMRHAGAALAQLNSLPVYAVGAQTAAAAQVAGFAVAATGVADAAALLTTAASAGHNRLLWLAGHDHNRLTPPALMQIDTHIVYRSNSLPVPRNFSDNLTPPCCVLLHSARAAEHFSKLCTENAVQRGAISIAAISQNVADMAGLGWRHAVIAAAPNDDALLPAALTCFTNDDCGP